MNKKSILVLLCALAIVAASVFGTLAYLTDSEAVTNTFTVGQVGIKLDEADVKTDGSYVTDAKKRVDKNEYHLLPGHTYIKDPTIHVDADSEDCYLFVKVENGLAEIEASETIAEQMARLHWKPVQDVENVYIFAKEGDKYAISKGGDVVVFEKFTIDGDNVVNVPEDATAPSGAYDIADYDSPKAQIKVTAYAVQKAGFEKTAPADIWGATFGKANANP